MFYLCNFKKLLEVFFGKEKMLILNNLIAQLGRNF